MTPIYLSFPDEPTAQAALDGMADLQIANPMPMPICTAEGAPVPGYHVNALAEDGVDLTALDPWRRWPETPWAVWAGV